jgi:predicted small integral membrane protein
MRIATIVACCICFVVVANVIAYQTVFQSVHLLYLDRSFFDTPRTAVAMSTAAVLAKQKNIAIFYNTFLYAKPRNGEKRRGAIGLSRNN